MIAEDRGRGKVSFLSPCSLVAIEGALKSVHVQMSWSEYVTIERFEETAYGAIVRDGVGCSKDGAVLLLRGEESDQLLAQLSCRKGS